MMRISILFVIAALLTACATTEQAKPQTTPAPVKKRVVPIQTKQAVSYMPASENFKVVKIKSNPNN